MFANLLGGTTKNKSPLSQNKIKTRLTVGWLVWNALPQVPGLYGPQGLMPANDHGLMEHQCLQGLVLACFKKQITEAKCSHDLFLCRPLF